MAGRLRSYTRRSVLIGSAAVAGGVAFGAYLVHRPHDNPLERGLGEGAASFNPWVMISDRGITLVANHTDVGQGARSLQAMLIAEELDIGLDQATIIPGQPAPAYYNTAGADEAVPFSPLDDSFVATTLRGVVGAAFKVIGVMATGGSSTVPDQYDKLRAAGAMARETLKLAAARRTGVEPADLRTRRGQVLLPDGRAIGYIELAGEAAALAPVRDTPLRDPASWRLLGRPVQRTDIVAKSTGTLRYGIDHHMDGMVYAALRLNPRQGGALLGHDATAARKMPGVIEVVEITGGIAVVASNTWLAMQAVEAIVCDWGPAPYPHEMAAQWQALEDSFTDARRDSRRRDDGDVEAALDAASDSAIAGTYRVPYLAHAPLEPLTATVRVQPGRVDVWSATQLPIIHRDNLALQLGVDSATVHLHNQFAGGSFGHRLEDTHIGLCAQVAAALPGVPVKLTYSREEDFAHDYPRPIAMARFRGAARDGRVQALDLTIAAPSVFASQLGRAPSAPPLPGPDASIVQGSWEQPLAIPDFRVTGYRMPPDSHAPVSSWRSVGASGNAFFFNSALDELILAAGGDPLLERLRLITDPSSRKCVEAVAEMSGWGSPLAAGRGRGVAFCLSFGTPVAEVVEVALIDGRVKVEKVWVAAEVGRVLDPVNFDNLVKGGVIWGLGHAMNCEITYADGMARQQNYHAHAGMRMHQCPRIEVRGLENGTRMRGIGEPPVPPAAPALAGAIHAATGVRLREMPFHKFVDFV